MIWVTSQSPSGSAVNILSPLHIVGRPTQPQVRRLFVPRRSTRQSYSASAVIRSMLSPGGAAAAVATTLAAGLGLRWTLHAIRTRSTPPPTKLSVQVCTRPIKFLLALAAADYVALLRPPRMKSQLWILRERKAKRRHLNRTAKVIYTKPI
jgi:hypothetical protein